MTRSDPILVDMLTPGREELDFLQQVLDVHPLTIEDILTPNTREKVDVFDSYIFIVIHCLRPGDADGGNRPAQLILIISRSLVIMLHSGHLDEAMAILRLARANSASLHVDFMLYTIFDVVSAAFLQRIQLAYVEAECIDDLTAALSRHDMRDLLYRISKARAVVSELQFALTPKLDLLAALHTHRHAKSRKDTDRLLRSLLERVRSMQSTIRVRDIAARMPLVRMRRRGRGAGRGARG